MKSQRLSFIISLFAALILCQTCKAQDPPMKWGEIPRNDLEMKAFPQDTNAAAVILCDYGETTMNNELNLVYKRHLRVKILTTKGYEWGTHSVVIYTAKHAESVRDIEGVTYWLNDKGEVEKNELKNKDIFEEEINNNYSRYNFTLPGLKPGSVIEMRYTIEADRLSMIRDWTFQHSEPVCWSEYRMRIPKAVGYACVTLGFEPYEISDLEEASQVFSSPATGYLGKDIVECNYRRYAVKDLPAIRNEPYSTTTKDYINRLDIQLSGYAFVGGGVEKVLNDWKTLVDELLDMKSFAQRIEETSTVRELAGQITANFTAPEEKMKAIYTWVSKSIVCTGENNVFAEHEVDDVIETKKGSNSEITFLLLSLLKAAGINGDPVMLSTRGNGKIQDIYPIFQQFNYVLARVNIGSNYYLLDATDPMRTYDILPTKVLNVRGLLVKKDAFGWIPVGTNKQSINNTVATICLLDDGSIKGTIEDLYSEYAALRIRRDLKDKKDIDIAKQLLETEQAGITIDSVSVISKDSIEAPIIFNTNISSSSYAQTNGDLIYINPQLVNRNKENPFKTKTRKFPVDYSYRTSQKTFITITIPEGFEVREKLNDVNLTAALNGIIYSRKVQVDSNKITLLTKLDIKEVEIKPVYYEQLREFYSRMVAAESEQIVLSRMKPVTEVQKAEPLKITAPESSLKTETKINKGKNKNDKRKF